MLEKHCEDRWKLLLKDYSLAITEKYWILLSENYTEKTRHYHTLEHIWDCLSKFDWVKHQVENPLDVEIAIWFHDIVYKAHKNDNEQKSAKLAEKCLTELTLDPKHVYSLIMLTKHPSIPKNNDECLLLDIDLSILGEDPDVFERYEENIRKEYWFYPKPIYSSGRKKVLQSLASHSTLFHTKLFQNKFEQQARKNIDWALSRL